MIHLKIPAGIAYTTLGALVALIVEPLPPLTKFGLLFSGALLGSLFLIFRSISSRGTKGLTPRMFEVFGMLIMGLVVGGCLVEILAYRFSLYQQYQNGAIPQDSLPWVFIGTSFAIAAGGFEGIKWAARLAADILRQRLGAKDQGDDKNE